ncbi:MAG: hydantoinase/oxoprolinase family protein [Pseudomonadota bacterium]
MSGVRAGVDIGGTFTDVALMGPGVFATAKVLTDHGAPEAAIVRAITIACERGGVDPGDLHQIVHGTTLVTNALIERRGAKTAFITTEGFRDVIEMRSENRFEQYDLNLQLPTPLVARADRFVAAERVDADGNVLAPLEAPDVARLVDKVAAGLYASVAVGFLHAYANDRHERMMGDALTAALPGISVSLSSVVSRQVRELPRFNTVIANAYVRPQVAAYLGRLTDALRAAGVCGAVYMLHSGGGLMHLETAKEQPVKLLESGPAGGAIFAAGFARAHGIDKALSFDMGGTTAKICLVEDGAPKTATTFEVARSYRFKKGSGMTVSTPVVEMVEIGAGGGSIASVDAMGRIAVGPRSAGSEPGPASYQRGGTAPTVTDANLILGRLDAEGFAGGAIPLSPALAEAAVAEGVALPLGLEAADAAFGITEMVDENMGNAARVHAIENGRDIEHFTMVAFGGGAPLHACRLCEKLGLARLIIPPSAGVGSAIGFLRAPFTFEATRGLFQRLETLDVPVVNAALAELEAEASAFVRAGAGEATLHTALVAFMRYAGQGWEIPVPLAATRLAPGDGAHLRHAFEMAYRTLFGRIIDDLAVEVTNWSVTVSTARPAVTPITVIEEGAPAPAARTRAFFDAALRKTVKAAEVPREALGAGQQIEGPAIIVEDETTTIVTSAFRAVGQADGSILLVRKGRG